MYFLLDQSKEGIGPTGLVPPAGVKNMKKWGSVLNRHFEGNQYFIFKKFYVVMSLPPFSILSLEEHNFLFPENQNLIVQYDFFSDF